MTIDQQIDDDELDALIERGDDEEERSGGYRLRPWWYLKTEGDVAILRFLEESANWRKVPTHRFFPTKPEPKDHEGKWPEKMHGTCRAGRLASRYPQGCAICTSGFKGDYGKGSKADDIRYTLAIERESYKDDNGRTRYRDKTVEVPVWDPETGEVSENQTITLPSLVMVGETMFRMMSNLKATGEAIGSLLTQDMRVKLVKNPSGSNGLVISSIPLERDDTILPGTEHWEMYQHTQKLWKPGGLVLNREIMYRASDEWWNLFFLMQDGRTYKEHEMARGGGDSQPATATKSAGVPKGVTAEEPTPDRLAEVRARILQQG